MLRRISLTLAVLAGVIVAPMNAHAATVRIDMYNCYFQPWSIVAAPGDTVELYNWGGSKTVESYSGQSFGPVTIATNQTATFTYDGAGLMGLRAADTALNGSCQSSVSEGACSGMCARVTATAPENPPQVPVVTTPTPSQVLAQNIVQFSGTAENAAFVRVSVQPGNIVVQPPAPVDVNGNWAVSRSLPNGSWTARAVSIHGDGFESAAATVEFSIQGGDTLPPRVLAGNPARVGGQVSPLQFGSLYVGHGIVMVNGVVDDDVEAKAVKAHIRHAVIPGVEADVHLTCSNPNQFGAAVPCNNTAGTNPHRISYNGTWSPTIPGPYILTVTATDGTLKEGTAVQDIVVLSPL